MGSKKVNTTRQHKKVSCSSPAGKRLRQTLLVKGTEDLVLLVMLWCLLFTIFIIITSQPAGWFHNNRVGLNSLFLTTTTPTTQLHLELLDFPTLPSLGIPAVGWDFFRLPKRQYTPLLLASYLNFTHPGATVAQPDKIKQKIIQQKEKLPYSLVRVQEINPGPTCCCMCCKPCYLVLHAPVLPPWRTA
jgi:hypothetical protein